MTYVSSGDPRDQLVDLGRSVVSAGLVVGSGGNLSVRIPGTDECWVTAAGTWLDRLDRRSFVRVRLPERDRMNDDVGDEAPTGASSPTSELGLHVAAYRVRPDVAVVVHLHPQSVLLLEALGEPIRLATTDHVYYLRDVGVVPFHPPGTNALSDAAAVALADGLNCLVLARHGCCVVADTVELAHKRALYLEEAAVLTYQALQLGRVAELEALPPGMAAATWGASI